MLYSLENILFLGNLSNPSINRWGLNLFWYNFWYSDKNSKFLFHQEYLINKLLYNFIFYGLDLNKFFFFNLYWYKKTDIFINKLLENINNYNTHTDTFVEYKSKLDESKDLVFYRKKKKYIYISKIWILRFQSWCIINFYSIQEIISKEKILNSFDFIFQKYTSTFTNYSYKIELKKSFIRSILLFKKINFITKNSSHYYLF